MPPEIPEKRSYKAMSTRRELTRGKFSKRPASQSNFWAKLCELAIKQEGNGPIDERLQSLGGQIWHQI